MSLATLKTKVEQLIEKAQSGGDYIVYPEWEYIRPANWLPRPELTLGEDTNEIWALIEVDESETEHDGAPIENAVVVAEGKKQFWKKYTPKKTNAYINEYQIANIPQEDIPNVVELIFNSIYPISMNYRYQRDAYIKLEIVSGTPFTNGSYYQDGFLSIPFLRVFDCEQPLYL